MTCRHTYEFNGEIAAGRVIESIRGSDLNSQVANAVGFSTGVVWGESNRQAGGVGSDRLGPKDCAIGAAYFRVDREVDRTEVKDRWHIVPQHWKNQTNFTDVRNGGRHLKKWWKFVRYPPSEHKYMNDKCLQCKHLISFCV